MRLLLLMHLTFSQFAQNIEILSFRYINNFHNYYYSVFIKNGIINIIISYYKEYSVIKLIKIIYRYLPKKVDKLLIYYL